MLENVEHRIQLAEQERTDDLVYLVAGIYPRVKAPPIMRTFERLSLRDQLSDDGIRQLIFSCEETERDFQTRQA